MGVCEIVGTLGSEVKVILRGWERLAVIYRRSHREAEKTANSGFGSDEGGFVLARLSGVEVCRFAGL